MRWLWPVLVVALGSCAAFHDECDDENSESCALSALQRRAHVTSGGEFGASLVVKMSWLKKKPMNRQSIEGRFFLVKNSSSFCGSSSSVICNLGVLQSMEMMWSFLGGKVLHFSMEA